MFKKKAVLLFIGVFITLLFFNKFIFKGFSYFPGDLLINNYSPWKYYSYLGYNPGSYPSKFQYADVARQLYPWKILSINLVKSGQLPLWNPYSFSGTPLAANMQSQVFSPLNLLYFVFGNIAAWNLSLILQVLLAFFFTYLYSRKLKLSEEAAVLSGIAYSCSLYMSTFFEYGVFGQTIMWLPLILYGIEEVVERASIKGVLILTLAIAFCCFGGHLQLFAYVLIFSFFYGLFRFLSLEKKSLSNFIYLIIPAILSLGISAIQLLPTVELINLSARAPHNANVFFSDLMLRVSELITIVSPDIFGNPATGNYLLNKSYPQTALYIGILPLIFALTAVVIKKNWNTKFYISAAIVVLLLVVNNPIAHIFYSLPIPFLSTSAPTNGIFLLSFCLSILAGFGFQNFIEKNKDKKSIYVGLFIAAVLVLMVILFKAFHVEFNLKNTILSFGILGISIFILSASSFLKQKKLIILALIVLSVVDLFYYFQKFNPAVPSSIIFPPARILSDLKSTAGIRRFWSYGAADVEANFSVETGLYSPEGYDPLYDRSYGQLIYASGEKLLPAFNDQTRSDATFLSNKNLLAPDQLKVLNLVGVSYILDRVENGSTEKTFPSKSFYLVENMNGWKIIGNSDAVPRIFLTSDYKIYNTSASFSKIFFAKNFDERKSVLLDENPEFPAASNNSPTDKVEIKSYSANNIKLQTYSNKTKLLFLSDAYYPGWKAYVDGVGSKIYQADYAFRAVVVPAGGHNVQFIYSPTSFELGWKVSLISLFVLIALSCIIYIKGNEKR